MTRLRVWLIVGVALLGVSRAESAQTAGRIAGRVIRDAAPLAGVMAVVQETGAVEWTAPDGTYTFSGLRAGTYTILLTLGTYSAVQMVSVDGATVTVETTVDWPLSFIETLVVSAPSRYVERATYAPAPVTRLEADDAKRMAAQGQLPRLLAYAPGVHVTQSGLFDFNVNARGFNEMVNRRVRTEVDGRDTSRPHVMGATNWAAIPFALDEIDTVELVRGGGAALYGAGAFNGVLSIRTKPPDASLGGSARITLGELNTTRIDGRHAGQLGDWGYFKVAAGYQRSADFSRARVTQLEYAPDRLPHETIPLVMDRVTLVYGSVRVDRLLASGRRFVAEAGSAYTEGTITVTPLGRFQATDVRDPWARLELSSARWRARGSWTAEDGNNQVSLSSGTGTYQSGSNLQMSVETNAAFHTGRGRFVAGSSYGRQAVDSANDQGLQTIWAKPETVHDGSGFGQAEYRLTSRLKAIVAGRLDASSLHAPVISPRAALVYELAPSHVARVAVNRAFKAPTITEYRLQVEIAPALNLLPLEAALAPVLNNARLGFERVPLLAVGNEDLEVEEVTGVDIGYTGLVGTRTVLNAGYYRNALSTFTSGLLPQVGTSLGRLNSAYGPYRVPAGVSAQAAAIVTATLTAALPSSLSSAFTNLADGSPAIVLLSLGNFGSATAQGVEIGATTMVGAWRLEANYTWFDHGVDLNAPDIALLPNTPAHQAGASVSYVAPRFDGSLRYRWGDAFDWQSGIYAGRVPAHGLVDMQVAHPVHRRLRVGVDVANLLDNDHYEMFGGDLLGRRALVHATVSW